MRCIADANVLLPLLTGGHAHQATAANVTRVLDGLDERAPLLALALSTLPHSRTLRLPERVWLWLLGFSAVGLLLAALLSPYRAPSLLATLTPLAVCAFPNV